MKQPIVIIPSENTSEEWGLGYDGHCVTLLHKWGKHEEWDYYTGSHIPHNVAIHVSAVAQEQEIYSTALGAGHKVVGQYLQSGRIKDEKPPSSELGISCSGVHHAKTSTA